MKIVKYHIGTNNVHPVDMKDFKDTTKESFPYKQTVNGEMTALAYCPICNNSVRLLGIYKPIIGNQDPHARHTKMNIAGFPNFDEPSYLRCPYHRKKANYVVEVKKKNASADDLAVLQLAKDNFDRCIYLIKNATGLIISVKFAEEILSEYIGKRGYMTYDRTPNNIPWIMLIDMPPISPWKRLVVKNSPIHRLLARNNVTFSHTDNPDILRIEKDNNLSLTTANYRYSVDDKTVLHEYVTLTAITPDGKGTYIPIDSIDVEVNPYIFNRLIHSSHSYRNQEQLDIAKRLIP